MKNILVVEDNEDDLFILEAACQTSTIPHALHCVDHGQAALDYLFGAGKYADRTIYPLPDLIFLDAKLPKVTGYDVLERLRHHATFKHLPIVMLTVLHDPADVERAYKLGVTSYLLKSLETTSFFEGIQTVLQFWLRISEGVPTK